MAGCRPLTDEEKQKMLKAFKGTFSLRNVTLFVLGSKTGFRISELLSLRVKQVWDGENVRDYVKVSKENMKGKRYDRRVPLHPQAKALLKNLIHSQGANPDQFLFKSRKGKNQAICIEQAWKILKAAYELSELMGRLATHSMRKTFAQDYYAAVGKDIYKTQKAMGHAKIETTIRYLSATDEEIEKAFLDL